MKKLLLAFIGIVLINTTFPVLAGPNWPLIEEGRKAQSIRMHQESSAEATTRQQASKNAKMEKMMKECQEMMNKG